MGTLLNAVIGMSAIYLFVSLLVTSLQELIAQALALLRPSVSFVYNNGTDKSTLEKREQYKVVLSVQF